MKVADLSKYERRRIEALRRTALLDTPASPEFDDATKLASYICGTPIALISLVDEHRQWFKSRVGLTAQETPRDVAFCAHAILSDEVFVVPDALEDPRFFDNPLVTNGPRVRFYAGAPLVTPEGDALGTLCVIDQKAREITEEQRDALATLARQVMAQVALHERTSELVRYGNEMTVVEEFGELLQSCRSTEETSEVTSIYARRLFTTGYGMVGVTNSSRNLVESLASWGNESPSEPTFDPTECWALRRGRPHLVSSKTGGVRCRHVRSDSGGYACIPMMAHGETVGILHVANAGPELPKSLLQLAIVTSERVGLALANTRLREQLRLQSIRDPLTGLFNRRYLEESLDREVKRCLRHDRPLTLFMIDVDHFKRYNDECGHAAGDAVLQALGRVLREAVRVEDIVCRYGGEEFVVVLPDGDGDACAARANELCAAVKKMVVEHRGAVLRTISISIGVASLAKSGSDGHELLRAADAALYSAKKQGRDRVVEAAASAPDDTATSFTRHLSPASAA